MAVDPKMHQITSKPSLVISDTLLTTRNLPKLNTGFYGSPIWKSNLRPFPLLPNPSFLPFLDSSSMPPILFSLIQSTTLVRQSLLLSRYCTGDMFLLTRCRCWLLSPIRCSSCSPIRCPSHQKFIPVMGERRWASFHSIPLVRCWLDSHSSFRNFLGLQFLSLLRSNYFGPTLRSLGWLWGGGGVQAPTGWLIVLFTCGSFRTLPDRGSAIFGRWIDLFRSSASYDSSLNRCLRLEFSFLRDWRILSFSLLIQESSFLTFMQFSSVQSMCHSPIPFFSFYPFYGSLDGWPRLFIFLVWELSPTTQLCLFTQFLSYQSLAFYKSLRFLLVCSSYLLSSISFSV